MRSNFAHLPPEFDKLVAIVARVENDPQGRPRRDRLRYSEMLPRKSDAPQQLTSIPGCVQQEDGRLVPAQAIAFPLGEMHDTLSTLMDGPMKPDSADGFFSTLLTDAHALNEHLFLAGRL